MRTDTNPELSIVIPAKNEEKQIGALLDSILAQDYQCIARTPIIVADAKSRDRTRQVARGYDGKLNVQIVDGGWPSEGRNRGAAVAESKYVLFIDADLELRDPTIIRRALAFADERALHCVAVYVRCLDGNLLDRFLFWVCNASKKPYGVGMFLLFQKSAFDALQGFDEKVTYGEDALLMKGVERKRFGIVPGFVFTSNRGFRKRGYRRVIWLAFLNTVNLLVENRAWFHKEHHWF